MLRVDWTAKLRYKAKRKGAFQANALVALRGPPGAAEQHTRQPGRQVLRHLCPSLLDPRPTEEE